MDPGLSYQVPVTGFSKDMTKVQGCTKVSFHWGGKPALVRCKILVNATTKHVRFGERRNIAYRLNSSAFKVL